MNVVGAGFEQVRHPPLGELRALRVLLVGEVGVQLGLDARARHARVEDAYVGPEVRVVGLRWATGRLSRCRRRWRRRGHSRGGNRRGPAALGVTEVRGVELRTALLVGEPVVQHGAGGEPADGVLPRAAVVGHPDVLLPEPGHAGVVDVDVERRRHRGEVDSGVGRVDLADALGVVGRGRRRGRGKHACGQKGRGGEGDRGQTTPPPSKPCIELGPVHVVTPPALEIHDELLRATTK